MMGDLTVHMPASMCQRLDRSSMAHSLEARVPFLSHRFVDFALTVPTDAQAPAATPANMCCAKPSSRGFRRAQLDQRKIGFQLPLADWFMGGFNDFAREAWSSSGAAELGLLDKAGVDRLFDEHRSGKADHGRMLYAIAMFSCWWKDQRSTVSGKAPAFQDPQLSRPLSPAGRGLG